MENKTFEAYMLFRMTEAEHVQKAYNEEETNSSELESLWTAMDYPGWHTE